MIDGYSRYVVIMNVEDNNKAGTWLKLFVESSEVSMYINTIVKTNIKNKFRKLEYQKGSEEIMEKKIY